MGKVTCEHAYLNGNCPFCVIVKLRAENTALRAECVHQQRRLMDLTEELESANRRVGQLKRVIDEERTNGVRAKDLRSKESRIKNLQDQLARAQDELFVALKHRAAA